MSDSVKRREVLKTAAAVGALAALGPLALGRREGEAGLRPQIFGGGRITANIPGETVPSPSDFVFTADPGGGTILCSMFGPETGGFLNCILMTVQGTVAPGTLQRSQGVYTFGGKLDLFLFPDIFNPPNPFLYLTGNDYSVRVTLGGPGRATWVLKIPVATAAIGGDTGGIVDFGRIERRRIRL
jgi:hypothetical protein